jgi:uracil-DNA glycosylase
MSVFHALPVPLAWQEVLGDTLRASEWLSLERAVSDAYLNEAIAPPHPLLFRALECVPPQSVRVVVLGQDPYHTPGVADGLAFSTHTKERIPPSLRNIFIEIADEFHTPVATNPDLTRFAKQGVLLLNTTLSVRLHAANSHKHIGWHLLTDSLISAVSNTCPHVVFLLWGNHAISKGVLINEDKHLVLRSPHPSPLSAYRGFFGNGHFVQANTFLISHGMNPIDWT